MGSAIVVCESRTAGRQVGLIVPKHARSTDTDGLVKTVKTSPLFTAAGRTKASEAMRPPISVAMALFMAYLVGPDILSGSK